MCSFWILCAFNPIAPSVTQTTHLTGINLPMGVRVRHIEDTTALAHFWTPHLDATLQSLYSRYGPNWHICATVVGASARQCRLRYKMLSDQKKKVDTPPQNTAGTIASNSMPRVSLATTASRLRKLAAASRRCKPPPLSLVPTSNNATLAPAHTSHDVTIQTSVNGSSLDTVKARNGEYWPLGLLDFSDSTRGSNGGI